MRYRLPTVLVALLLAFSANLAAAPQPVTRYSGFATTFGAGSPTVPVDPRGVFRTQSLAEFRNPAVHAQGLTVGTQGVGNTTHAAAGCMNLDMLDGAIKAKEVYIHATAAHGPGQRAQVVMVVTHLQIGGVPHGTLRVAPNSTVNVPGVGVLIMNQQQVRATPRASIAEGVGLRLKLLDGREVIFARVRAMSQQ